MIYTTKYKKKQVPKIGRFVNVEDFSNNISKIFFFLLISKPSVSVMLFQRKFHLAQRENGCHYETFHKHNQSITSLLIPTGENKSMTIKIKWWNNTFS